MAVFPSAFRPSSASVDLTDFDLAPAAGLARDASTRLAGLAKDVTYTAIGMGILGLQRAQARRHQIHRMMQR